VVTKENPEKIQLLINVLRDHYCHAEHDWQVHIDSLDADPKSNGQNNLEGRYWNILVRLWYF
jgi:hypothetical protein